MQALALMEVIQLRVFQQMALSLYTTVQEVTTILHLRPHQYPTKIPLKE
jgi:hypothetical protein